MFAKTAFFLLPGVILVVSCATERFDEGRFEETIAVVMPRSYTIIEYKNLAGDMPEWLRLYLDTGERLVETMADYSGDYIFVTTEKGSELAALEKWSEYYRVEQDFSQAVFLRMYNRLVAESEGRPDYYRGNFFEVFLKKIAGHTFEDASRADDYWIKIALERDLSTGIVTPDENGPGAAALSADSETDEEYRYYILSKINKTSFEKDVMSLFSDALVEANLEKAQTGVVSKLQSTLFAGF